MPAHTPARRAKREGGCPAGPTWTASIRRPASARHVPSTKRPRRHSPSAPVVRYATPPPPARHPLRAERRPRQRRAPLSRRAARTVTAPPSAPHPRTQYTHTLPLYLNIYGSFFFCPDLITQKKFVTSLSHLPRARARTALPPHPSRPPARTHARDTAKPRCMRAYLGPQSHQLADRHKEPLTGCDTVYQALPRV